MEFDGLYFYSINPKYLKFLHDIDKEVYYDKSYISNFKPFVGIIIGIREFEYFIPLTSAKEKHKKWRNVTDSHFLVYSIVDRDSLMEGRLYKNFSDSQIIEILSVLDVKKMIPVPKNAYKKIDIDGIEDEKYKILLNKEHEFLLGRSERIIKSVENTYLYQINTQVVKFAHCNYSLLEKNMENWTK